MKKKIKGVGFEVNGIKRWCISDESGGDTWIVQDFPKDTVMPDDPTAKMISKYLGVELTNKTLIPWFKKHIPVTKMKRIKIT